MSKFQFPSKNNDWLEEEIFDDEPWDSSDCCEIAAIEQRINIDQRLNVASGEDVCLDAY